MRWKLEELQMMPMLPSTRLVRSLVKNTLAVALALLALLPGTRLRR